MATPAAHTAALMELNQTMVNLTPTLNQLVVTLTPQPEARKKSLSVAPSTATSEKARQIQRRLGYHFDYNNKGPHSGGDHLQDLPMFEWAAFRAEDDAAAQACEYLQVHFAPEKCTVIAVQRVPWLGQEWDFPDVHLHIRRGKTDYLFIWTGQGGNCRLKSCFRLDELRTPAMVRRHKAASPHHTLHVGSTAALPLTKLCASSQLWPYESQLIRYMQVYFMSWGLSLG